MNNSPSTGSYSSMNRNSGSNWSSQGDNYDSRNRYSGMVLNITVNFKYFINLGSYSVYLHYDCQLNIIIDLTTYL